MKDEIKEILNKAKEISKYGADGKQHTRFFNQFEAKLLLDYITNLQEELKYSIPQVQHNQIVSKLAEEKHILQEENKRLKEINEEHRKLNGTLHQEIKLLKKDLAQWKKKYFEGKSDE